MNHAHPSRRRVVRHVAWAAPAVALTTAAPARAASADPCAPKTVFIDWSNTATWTRAADGSWARAVLYAGTPDEIALTVTARPLNEMRIGSATKGNQNFTLTPDAIGGSSDRGLTLHQYQSSQTPMGRTNRVVYSFAFSDAAGRPVTASNIRFTLTDLDSTAGDFWDAVDLSRGFVLTQLGSGIIGTGTPSSPLMSAAEDQPFPNSSGAGNASVMYPSATSFSVTYWSAVQNFSGVDSDQKIFLSDLQFTYSRVVGC